MEERNHKDPSTQDVLDAINNFAERVEERFTGINQRFNRLESDVGKIKATMVTKDYLDTRMLQLRGDLVGYDKMADAKTDALVDVLHSKKGVGFENRLRHQRLEPVQA